MTTESPLAVATLLIVNNQAKFIGRRSWLKIVQRTPEYMALRRPGHSVKGAQRYRRASLEFWKLTPGPEGTWLGRMVMEVPLR